MSEWIELEGGIVVDESTGEILEGSPEDAVQRFTELALDAGVQAKQWDAQQKLYRLMLLRLGVEDVTTTAGRAVKRGRTSVSATREAWDASFMAQDLSYDEQAFIWLEAGKALDPKKLDELFEDGKLPGGSSLYDDLVKSSRSEWVEVKPLKKQAPERVISTAGQA